MLAKMQECNGSKNPILMRMEKDAGHGFGKPVSKMVNELAEKWTFLYNELGL